LLRILEVRALFGASFLEAGAAEFEDRQRATFGEDPTAAMLADEFLLGHLPLR
jgi:hypothetical protein